MQNLSKSPQQTLNITKYLKLRHFALVAGEHQVSALNKREIHGKLIIVSCYLITVFLNYLIPSFKVY